MPHDTFHVVRFRDGVFDDLRSFTVFAEAAGYSRGFVSGAGAHGMPRAFVLPNETADLEEYEKTGVSILAAYEAIADAAANALPEPPSSEVESLGYYVAKPKGPTNAA